MKLKQIFTIGSALTFLQALPVYISMVIPDMKNMLMEDAFGSEINYTKEKSKLLIITFK